MTKKENKTKKKIKKKKEKQVKKKTRRSKKIKNALRKFTIVYQNIRGLKSKVDSVQELVDDCQPNLLCLVETHMQEEEKITIPGYETIYRNDKTSNSGGILIAVKDTLKTITMQVKQETEVGQILLNNQKKKKKIKVGVIYAPQEGVTPNKELKKLYTSITEEIIKAKEENQQSIIIGVFNAKIGDRIKGKHVNSNKRWKAIDKND